VDGAAIWVMTVRWKGIGDKMSRFMPVLDQAQRVAVAVNGQNYPREEIPKAHRTGGWVGGPHSRSGCYIEHKIHRVFRESNHGSSVYSISCSDRAIAARREER